MEFAEDGTPGRRDLGRLPLGRVPLILMYHSVEGASEDPYHLCVTPERFAGQMRWLTNRGLRGVSVDTLLSAVRAGRGRGLVGITFDDGYLSVLRNAVPELLRHDFTATMFIVSGLLGGTNEWDGRPVWPLMSAQQVAEVAAAGMEIGSHSVTHPRLTSLGARRLRAEISESRSMLSDLLGCPVRGFAYPYGDMSPAARHAVEDTGYDYACSVVSPVTDMGMMTLPRIIVGQRDGAAGMAAKRILFRGQIAAKGMKMAVDHNPLGQEVKRRLHAVIPLPGGNM